MPLHWNKTEADVLGAYVKLMRAADSVTAATHRHLAEENLTVTQFGVLEALHHLGPMCQRDVARKNLKSTGNITTVVDNLEKRGLVERRRSDKDRRYIALHLTEAGRDLIERTFPRHLQIVLKSFAVLSAEEQQELARLCKKLGTAQKT
ncbi:MAG: MarR family transcriptional regulator [Desulfuromonadales bacterium]|jgi:MarR family 2-MHQ and catechol resistance regulon transcriptional repressor